VPHINFIHAYQPTGLQNLRQGRGFRLAEGTSRIETPTPCLLADLQEGLFKGVFTRPSLQKTLKHVALTTFG
jgi:hypothetical protein